MTVSREESPRERLLDLIVKRGPITIKELKQETGMSTGSLYHHLSKLAEYITQDQQKRYLLSESGRQRLARAKPTDIIPQQRKIVWFISFMFPAVRSKYASILTIIAVLQLYVLLYADSGQLLLLPVRYGGQAESILLGYVLSVLAAEGLCIAAGARPGRGMLALAAGISIATVPVVAFSMVDEGQHSYLAAMPLYALSLFIASSAISNAKGFTFAASVPVALAVLMVSIAAFTANLGAAVAVPMAITAAVIAMSRLGYFEMAVDALRTRAGEKPREPVSR